MGYSIRKTLEKIRNKRQTRLDAGDADKNGLIWRTTDEGNHIAINAKGEVAAGNPYVLGKIKQSGGKVSNNAKVKSPTPKKSEGNGFSGTEQDFSTITKGRKPQLFEKIRGNLSGEDKNSEKHVSAFIDRNDKEALKNVGNVTSGKNGDMKPKKDDARTIDTKDALKEVRDGKTNSLAEHMDENGNLSAERQAVHDEIIRNMFANKVPFDGQPTMIMSGGGPASGKSFITKNAKANFGEETVTKIDPDDIKKLLPGYTEMAKESDQAAAHYHEESSALAKRAYQFALDNGLNVVYDGTGDGSINSVKKKIDAAREAGCKVNGEYVTVDTEEAIRRNQKRYDDAKKDYESGKSDIPPRKPPEDYVRECHQKVTDISVEVAGLFDTFTLSDNNVPEGVDPIKIAECKKDGTITAVPGQEDKLQNFLDKGVAGHKVENGKVV